MIGWMQWLPLYCARVCNVVIHYIRSLYVLLKTHNQNNKNPMQMCKYHRTFYVQCAHNACTSVTNYSFCPTNSMPFGLHFYSSISFNVNSVVFALLLSLHFWLLSLGFCECILTERNCLRWVRCMIHGSQPLSQSLWAFSCHLLIY